MLNSEEKKALVSELGSQVVSKAEKVIAEANKEITDHLKSLERGNKLNEDQFQEILNDL